MKKTLFVAVLAGAALAGCVKNEPVTKAKDSPERITFDAPVVTIPTKATEIADNYPKDETFAVYAYYHKGDYTSFDASAALYMDNVTCNANNASAPDYWEPTPTYYWPKNGSLTFGAYAPVMVNEEGKTKKVDWGETGFKFNDYTVSTTSAEQKDLLYSERIYNQKESNMLTTPDPYKGITIVFKHALSSIVFTARSTEDDVVKLTGIKVNNVISKGSFNQGYRNVDGDADAEHPIWNLGGHDTRKVYVVYQAEGDNGGILLKAGDNNKLYFNATPGTVDGKRKSDLILIPQPLNTDGHKVSVTIEFSINGKNYREEFDLAVKNPSTEPGQDANLYEWKMGYRYTYDITIGLAKIYFNPKVSPWTDGTGITIQ